MRVYELANFDAAIFQIGRLRRFWGIRTSAVRICMTTGIQDPSSKNFERLALDGSKWRRQHGEGQFVDWRAGIKLWTEMKAQPHLKNQGNKRILPY